MEKHLELPPAAEIERIVTMALAEDIGQGDITSQLLIPADAQAEMRFVARGPMVCAGAFIPQAVYRALEVKIVVRTLAKDGQALAAGTVVAVAQGNARALLTGERVALNLMQRMCGVASLTKRFVEAVAGTKAVILDTRKTMPGLRALDKYAVRAGGGQNHRLRLDDMVLIKDNHIALAGDVKKALALARRGSAGLPVVVECDTLAQLEEALAAKPDRVLLDNMTHAELAQAVAMAQARVPLEASGGVTLETVRAIAETGVDYISVGGLTHSAMAVDLGADIEMHQ